MKHYIIAVLLLPGTLALLQGCKRTAPDDIPGKMENESGMQMVRLPGGWFIMGDEDEVDAKPHRVFVRPFFIDKHPVTQEEYQRVMGENPSRWKGSKNPVEQVRWSDAVRYCNARSRLEGLQSCYNLNMPVGQEPKQHIFLGIVHQNWRIMPGLKRTLAENRSQ